MGEDGDRPLEEGPKTRDSRGIVSHNPCNVWILRLPWRQISRTRGRLILPVVRPDRTVLYKFPSNGPVYGFDGVILMVAAPAVCFAGAGFPYELFHPAWPCQDRLFGIREFEILGRASGLKAPPPAPMF